MGEELLLALDTSTPTGSVAVTRGEVLLGESLLNGRGTHSDHLLILLQDLLHHLELHLTDFDAFSVVLGPGSFTGLRVGVATVQALGLATGKPVLGVSSLQTLAMQAPFAPNPVCALLDARKGEVYAGLFDWRKGLPEPLRPEAVLPPETLLASLEGETLFVGSGAVLYRSLVLDRLGPRAHFLPWPLQVPRASQAAALALADFRQGKSTPLHLLIPRYIRPSEAEIAWSRKASNGLNEG